MLITDRLAAIPADDGDVAWTSADAYAENVWFAPGGVVIVHDFDDVTRRRHVIARGLVTGDERWSLPAGSVLAAEGGELLLDAADRYVLVDGASGAELWSITPPDGASATAFDDADGTLFMSVTDDGKSTVLALRSPA